MPQDVVVTLLDETVLVMDSSPVAGRGLLDELEVWALVPVSAESEINRGDPAVWADALRAGELVYAVFNGVTADSPAWKIFPEAARFITASIAGTSEIDAADAAARARHRVASITGYGPHELRVKRSRLDEDQRWHVELLTPSGSPVLAVLTASGSATLIDMSRPESSQRLDPIASTTESDRGGYVPRVFVCYAHDSEEHKLLVRAFVEFLIVNGIDAHMDSWNQHERRDWQLWATGQIKAADFVLVIASPKCRRVGDGENEPDEHRGLRSEMNTLRELYHAQPSVWPKRILPVVLAGHSIEDIPIFLQPRTADHYVVHELTIDGAEDLLRHLTVQPAYVAPDRGGIPSLPPKSSAYGG